MPYFEDPQNKLRSYRYGLMDSFSCKEYRGEIMEFRKWYDRGWKDGKELRRKQLAKIRRELKLPPEAMVHIA